MTESLSLKGSLLNDWLENDVAEAQSKEHTRYPSKRRRLPASTPLISEDEIEEDDRLLLLRTGKRKISHLNGLARKVARLSTDNMQLKQCTQVLEMQRQSMTTQTASKEARVAALEKRLADAQRLLLLQNQSVTCTLV